MLKKICLMFMAIVLAAGIAGADSQRPLFRIISLEGVITSPSAKYVADVLKRHKKRGPKG